MILFESLVNNFYRDADRFLSDDSAEKAKTVQNTTKKGYNSKKYIFDTGIMNFFLTRGMPVSLSNISETTAQLFENSICQELVSCSGSSRALTSFKSNNKSSTELDFVVRTGREIIPVEVKAGKKITEKSLFQIKEFLKAKKIDRGFVVYSGMPVIRNIEKSEIIYLPPYMLNLVVNNLL